MTTEIFGTPAAESAALAFVLDHERRAGREPVDSRSTESTPADVVSGDRLIEVKAYSGTSRGNDLWLETSQAQAAVSRDNFHLYLVENVGQGDPALFRLLDVCGEQLQRLMTRAVERSYVTVPWPAAEYDALTSSEHVGVREEPASKPR